MNQIKRLITGGRIFTADPERPEAEALLIEGDKIAAVGDKELVAACKGSDVECIDIAGGLVVPGFVDGHVHITLTGSSMLKAQLQGSGSLEGIQQRLLEWAEDNPDEPRIIGTNWVHGDIPNGTPTRDMLDAIFPDRPVYLMAFDFHSSWVNSAALAELGITRDTPDPQGGRIVRDEKTGEATGYLLETANVIYVGALLRQLEAEKVEQNIVTALDGFCRAGITSVVDMAMEERVLEVLARLKARGELKVRVVAHMVIWPEGDIDEKLAMVQRAAELAEAHQGDFLRVTGIKIIADGTVDGCTAALSKPYTNGEHTGPIWNADDLNPVVAAADAANLQVAVHAIGDAAITLAVDAIEYARQVNGTSGRRHRIEHLEYALEEDIQRMGALGITASMQPVHLDPEHLDHWKEMLGPERANQGFAWPMYQEAGSTLAFGTDTPTAPYLPLINMYLASTRQSPKHPELPAIRPEWALSLEHSIVCGTRESAWAARLDNTTGMLRPGLAADLVVLNQDVLAGGPKALLETNVMLTLRAGEIVHSS